MHSILSVSWLPHLWIRRLNSNILVLGNSWSNSDTSHWRLLHCLGLGPGALVREDWGLGR